MVTLLRPIWLIATALTLLFATQLHAQERVQPAVAIKEPTVGDGVKGNAKKRLKLDIIWDELEASFRATRKFRVLSRNKADLAAVLEEQEFASSDLAKGDAAASGVLNNANYLILPTIQDFKFYSAHKKLPNFDSKYKRTDVGFLQISAKMIDTATGQVVANFSLSDKFNIGQGVVNGRGAVPSSKRFTKMAKTVAGQLADQFVNAVYPMKVVKRDRRGNVFINRGKDGGLKVGDIFDVFYAGEEMIDPDTGESLGASEEYVGQVKVSRINPKFTVAKVVKELDATNAPIGVGDILRTPQK
ncbi:FlgT C-terminal domain-containing protein [Neptunomonas sp. XY-337]|uniref:FlgT C-terminal domain-containing protein n=1 Tax=Neptunomonas sp. XY-337 TaxID=2561897 RepID=UPI00145AA33E|nr:FlgT C-terminal domain-containing protein [Neptunomonas sp. XY-337]